MVTVRDILGLEVFSGCTVRAGHEGLDRPVTGATVMEVPDVFRWLRPGDFVLTTLFAIHDDDQALKELIPKLSQSGCAGLAVKTKRYLAEIPAVALDYANALHFPIIELTTSMSHSVALESILKKLLADKLVAVEAATRNWHRLVALTLAHGDDALDQLLDATVQLVRNNPVALVRHGKLILRDSSEELSGLSLDILNQLPWTMCRDPDADVTAVFYAFWEANHRVARWYRFATAVQAHAVSLYVLERDQPLDDIQLMSCRYLVGIMALECARQDAQFLVEQRYQQSFLANLLLAEHSEQDRASLVAHARQLGWDFDGGPWAAVVMAPARFRSPQPGRSHVNADEVYRRLRFAAQELPDRAVAGQLGEQTVLVMRYQGDIEERVRKLVAYAHVSLDSVAAGIGRPTPVEAMHKSYQDANLVLEFLKWAHTPGIWHYDRLGVYRLLWAIQRTGELEDYVQQWLGPLLNYDAKTQNQLTLTLATYFASGGNVRLTAERLYVHYNTVINRLKQIERMLGGSVHNPEWAFSMQLATRAWEISQWGLDGRRGASSDWSHGL
jgi:purine catabolism regulator